jgi:hypothetical protein
LAVAVVAPESSAIKLCAPIIAATVLPVTSANRTAFRFVVSSFTDDIDLPFFLGLKARRFVFSCLESERLPV